MKSSEKKLNYFRKSSKNKKKCKYDPCDKNKFVYLNCR